jgi:SAM-dependent methyltransferase
MGADRPYITEQITPAFRHLKHMYPKTIGSEYVVDSSLRQTSTGLVGEPSEDIGPNGVHHEDVTQLSIASASVDAVLSFEVLEHVPDYKAALREFQRVLRPGGMLLVSVPFLPLSNENLTRAVCDADGSVRHLLEPEYHGDPMADAGCLAYYHFGWAILDDLRTAGFDRVGSLDVWSPPSGFLGGPLGIFLARKPNAELS